MGNDEYDWRWINRSPMVGDPKGLANLTGKEQELALYRQAIKLKKHELSLSKVPRRKNPRS